MEPLERLIGLKSAHLVELYPNHFLHPEVVKPITQLQNAAKKANIDLRLASSFRSFNKQCTIWNDKFNGVTPVLNEANQAINLSKLNDIEKIKAIARFSAVPGLSRHHWGTDIDVFDINAISRSDLKLIPSEYQLQGPCYTLNKWLQANCAHFGFFTPYSHNSSGVADEPWHLSYRVLADKFHQNMTAEVLHQALSIAEQNNTPIAGAETLAQYADDVILQYVQKIHR